MKCGSKNHFDISGRTVIMLFDVYYMLGGSYLGNIFAYRKSLGYLAVIVFGFMVIFRQYYVKFSIIEIKWMCVMLSVGALCGCVTGEFTLLVSAICILAGVSVDKVKLFFALLVEKTGFLTVSIILSALGIIPTHSEYYQKLYSLWGDGVVYRRSLGFMNYNILGLVVCEIIILYILLFWQKYGKGLRGIQYAVLAGIALLAYGISGSRTAFLSELVLLAIVKLSDTGRIGQGMLKKMIMTVIVGGCLFFSAGIVFIHDAYFEIYQGLDNLLQKRLLFIYRYIMKFGISVFGNNTKDLTGFWGKEAEFSWISLDCGYAVMVVKYGVAVSLLIVLIHIIYLYGRKCNVSQYVLCVMLAMSIYNISENVLVFPTINFSLLYFSDVIHSEGRIERKGRDIRCRE